jgi:hypothetical protein
MFHPVGSGQPCGHNIQPVLLSTFTHCSDRLCASCGLSFEATIRKLPSSVTTSTSVYLLLIQTLQPKSNARLTKNCTSFQSSQTRRRQIFDLLDFATTSHMNHASNDADALSKPIHSCLFLMQPVCSHCGHVWSRNPCAIFATAATPAFSGESHNREWKNFQNTTVENLFVTRNPLDSLL